MRLYVLHARHYVTTRERGKGITTLQWFHRDQSNLIPKSAIFIDNAESTSTFLAAKSLRANAYGRLACGWRRGIIVGLAYLCTKLRCAKYSIPTIDRA